MYKIINAQTGICIETMMNPTFLRQQMKTKVPVKSEGLFDADGVVLSDDTYCGIEGKNMPEYLPQVRVEKIDSDPYVFAQLDTMQKQVDQVYKYQTEDTVLKSDLDTAYREGVNSYTGTETTIETQELDAAYEEGVNSYGE